MIDFYTTHQSPNGWKVSIMLEELGLPYATHVIDVMKGKQFSPEFSKINPNNKIPAIVDHDGPDGKPITVFESGAILIYLARKTQSELLPDDPRMFITVIQWLMFQVSNVGPMLGQMGHFVLFAKEDVPYGKSRYTNEGRRILGVLDDRLAKYEYLAKTYSIADIATYGWMRSTEQMLFKGLEDWPNLLRWYEAIGTRPAVKKGLAVPNSEN